MTDSRKPPTLRERRRNELIERVERVAMEEFVSDGYENVSIGTICDRAGISSSTFFRHFENKEAVAAGVVRDLLDDTAVILRAESAEDGLVEPYLEVLRVQLERTGWATDGNLFRSTRLLVSRAFRTVFIDEYSRAEPGLMDGEIARRLRLSVDDPRIRMIRAMQWLAVDQAIFDLRPGDATEKLMEMIRRNFALLFSVEASLLSDGTGRSTNALG